MAYLYVTEHTFPKQSTGQLMPVVSAPAVAHQRLSIGLSSEVSLPFSVDTRVIRVHTDAICSIEIGASPDATTSKTRLAANSTEYFQVSPGDKIAVISNT